MELMTKQGYKNTEVGLIPEDWEVSTLDAITTLMTNGFVGTATTQYTESNDGVLYIQGYNVEENSFNFRGIKRVNQKFHKNHLKSCLKHGDLLTVQTGDVGLTTIVPKELEGSNCHALIISRFKHNRIYPWFYSQYFNSNQGRGRLKELEIGTTMKHLNVGDMKNWKIPLPPTLTEQKAIATALSDVDALIASLEQTITKKKAIKQGAMQQLLTPPHKGGKRLPGFSGEWVEKIIGKIGNTFGGLSGKTKRDFEDGKHPYITFLNVMYNTVIDTSIFEYVNLKPGEQQNKARKGDLFFNTSSETPEEVGMCAVLNEDFETLYLNSFCFGFRLKEDYEVDALFFSYLINSSIGRNLFLSLAQGATRYNLSKSNFNKLIIDIPKTQNEQKAIAQILSDMDAEIAQLETKKEKYQAIKQGMMQELLTGKTRLI